MRDSQVSKVYRWENREVSGSKANTRNLSLDDCKKIVYKCCDRYGLQYHPYVADGRGCTWARGGASRVTLPKWARNTVVVLHETAHCLCSRFFRGNVKHNDEFVRVFIELLHWFKIDNRSSLLKSARSMKVKVAPMAASPKPKKILWGKI